VSDYIMRRSILRVRYNMRKVYNMYISYILGKVMLTVLLCVAVNARSKISDITIHTHSRLNDINNMEHYSTFNDLKKTNRDFSLGFIKKDKLKKFT